MPTSYTYKIESGEINTAKDFLMLCTRAFGIAIDQRDESLSAPTKTIYVPDESYRQKYEKSVEDYNAAISSMMTIDEAKVALRTKHEEDISYAKRKLKENNEKMAKYRKILFEINDWNPPGEYIGIKRFAISQICDTIRCDDMSDYYEKEINKPLDDSDAAAQAYIDINIAALNRRMRDSKQRWDAEVKLAEEKTEFMRGFIESLNSLTENC